jgi:hypothetical protein
MEVVVILASTKISNHWLLIFFGAMLFAIIVIAFLFTKHEIREINKEKLYELFGTHGGRGYQGSVDKILKKLASEFNKLDMEERETGKKPRGLKKAKRAFWRAHQLAPRVGAIVRPKYTDYLS